MSQSDDRSKLALPQSADSTTTTPPEWDAEEPSAEKARRLPLTVRILEIPELGLLAALIIFGAIVQVENSSFVTYTNLILVAKAAAPTFFAAAMSTIVFVGGGLDLSVGSVAALGGVVAGALLKNGFPIPLAILLALAATGTIGAGNGVLVARFRIPALIVTLGALYWVRGVLLLTTKANIVFPLPQPFAAIGQNSIGKVPLLVVYAIVFGVLAHLLLDSTSYGYRVRAIGGNAPAARASGINVQRLSISLYALSGMGAGLAGILVASQLSTADPTTLVGFELDVISAVIIGGTSLFGAVGRIPGTALGVLLLACIDNGLLLIHVSEYWQQIVRGAIVIAAVGLDQFRRRTLWSVGVEQFRNQSLLRRLTR